jgi:hypothetical protein
MDINFLQLVVVVVEEVEVVVGLVVLVLQYQIFHFYGNIYLFLDQNTISIQFAYQKQVVTIHHQNDNEFEGY